MNLFTNFKKMTKKYLLLLTILHLPALITPARILIWMPTASISHQHFAQPIVRGISARGHNVTFITTNPLNDKTPNLTEVDVSFVYDMLKDMYKTLAMADFGIYQYKVTSELMPNYLETFRAQLEDEKVLRALKSEYDLLIVESVVNPILAQLRQVYKCPVIMLASVFLNAEGFHQIGDYLNPSYENSFFLPFRKPSNIWQKISVVLHDFWMHWAYEKYIIDTSKKMLEKVFDSSVIDYSKRRWVDLVLCNSHPILYGPRANFPNVIELGGLLKRDVRPLPKDLQTFLDSSPEGVIYFSLGTNVKGNLLGPKLLQVFRDAFKKLPYKVLWKFESEQMDGKPVNVRIEKWLPQIDVLNHPNTKLFITQGGIQSIEETIFAKVPILGMPFIGDQHFNVDRMVANGIALEVDKDTVTSEEFYERIMELMTNQSYHEKVTKLGELLDDAPMKPLDKAMYWIEYVIRHKGCDHLLSPNLHASWFEHFNIDAVATIFLALVTFVGLVVWIIAVCFRCIFGRNVKKVKRN